MTVFGWPRRRRREIFVYGDGARRRRADPLEVEKVLDAGGDWHALLDAAVGPDVPDGFAPPEMLRGLEGKRREATEELIGLSRRAFGLAEFDPETGRGLTGFEALGVLTSFVDYVAGLAAAADPLSGSPPSGAARTHPGSPPSSSPDSPAPTASGASRAGVPG